MCKAYTNIVKIFFEQPELIDYRLHKDDDTIKNELLDLFRLSSMRKNDCEQFMSNFRIKKKKKGLTSPSGRSSCGCSSTSSSSCCFSSLSSSCWTSSWTSSCWTSSCWSANCTFCSCTTSSSC